MFIASGPIGTAAVLSGEADVGIIGGFAPLRAMVGGAKGLVIIGQSKNLITSKIVGKKEIASVQDLKGKRLGIDRIGSNPDMFTQAALSPFPDRYRSKICNTFSSATSARSLPALKAGAIDAAIAGAPHDLFAQRLGFKVILDITALKIPFAATVLMSGREHRRAQTARADKIHARLRRSDALLSDQPEGTTQIVAKYTKVADREVLAYSIDSEAKAMEQTLQVDPKGHRTDPRAHR